MTWTKGAVPPRFGYFVEGQSNSRGRRPRSDTSKDNNMTDIDFEEVNNHITIKKEDS